MEVTRYQPKYLTALQALYLESRQDTFHWADADAFKLSDFDLDTEGEANMGGCFWRQGFRFFLCLGT